MGIPKSTNALMDKAIRDSRNHGSYFFQPDTIRFWNSKVVAGMFPNNTFVTSEDNFDRSKQLFTARLYDWRTHSVETIGEFQAFHNKEDAINFAVRY